MSTKKEKYASPMAERAHENSESAQERRKEYGTKKPTTSKSRSVLDGGPTEPNWKDKLTPPKKSTSPD